MERGQLTPSQSCFGPAVSSGFAEASHILDKRFGMPAALYVYGIGTLDRSMRVVIPIIGTR